MFISGLEISSEAFELAELKQREPIIEELDDSTAIPVSTPPVLMTYCCSLIELFANTTTFTLSRSPKTITGITDGLLYSRLGLEATAAAPLLSATSAGALSIITGPSVAAALEMSRRFNNNDYAGVGRVLQANYIVNTSLSIPIILLFVNSKKVLSLVVDPTIASTAAQFLVLNSVAFLGSSLLLVEQQFSLAVGNPKNTLISSISFHGLANIIGWPLALGLGPLPQMGLRGQAIGYLISSFANWGIFRGLHTYNHRNSQNQILSIPRSELKILAKEGTITSTSACSEAANLMIISFMLGRIGPQISAAAQPSSQLAAMFLPLLIGFSQAAAKHIVTLPQQQDKKIIAQSAMMVGILSATMLATLFFAMPQKFATLFGTESVSEEHEELIKNLFILQGIGLIFDATRNVATGLLRGFDRDLNFAALSNFIFLNLLGLPASAVMVFALEMSPEWIFACRTVAMGLAATACVARLHHKYTISNEQATPAPLMTRIFGWLPNFTHRSNDGGQAPTMRH